MLGQAAVSVSPALGRLRQKDPNFQGHPRPHSKFQASLSYMGRPRLKTNHTPTHAHTIIITL